MNSKEKFFSTLLERKLLIILAVIMIFAAGAVSYIEMPKQHFPKVVLPVATVRVVYPGASAEDIQELVADKVEQVCMELDGYDKCDTTIGSNYALINVTLSMDLSQDEVDKSFDELKDKLDELKDELPSGVTDISVHDDVMDTAGLILAVTGDNITSDDLSSRSKELADRLRLIDGVRKVDIHGDVPSEIKVRVNIDKLNSTSLSMAELASLISAHNSTIPLGTISVDNKDINVTSTGRLQSLDDIRNIIVATDDDNIITRLGDIADISMQAPEDEGYYIYNDKRSTVLAVYFRSGLNTVALGDDINSTIDSFNESLPDGIEVNRIFMQPDEVSDSINDFIINLLESIILVIIVIMIGMNLRNAAVVSVAIPLSIFMSFIASRLLGLQIHFVSLASLIVVLGMLVDNAVVVSDAIQKNLDAGMDKKTAVTKGAASVMVPVLISTVTTILAFCSLFVLPGAYRQLSISFPIVIIACLAASYLVSIFVTPLMSYLLLKPNLVNGKPKTTPVAGFYKRVSEFTFKHKRTTIIVSIVIALVALTSVTMLELQIIPSANSDIITVTLTGDDENNLERTAELVDNIEAVLDEQPETKYYISGIGTSIPRYDYSILPKADNTSLGDIFVKADFSKSDRFKNAGEMVSYLQGELDKRVGGASILVDELGIFALNSKPVEFKIYSDNADDLNTAAAMINSMMSDISGTKGVYTDNEIATYGYDINMDALKLNSLGLTQAEAQNELNIALMGRTVSAYRNGSKEYNIVLDSDIDSADRLKAFEIKSSILETKHSISQFANVALSSDKTSISRVDGRKGRIVGCYVAADASPIDIQTELEDRINESLDKFPQSVTIEASGKKKIFYEEVLSNIGVAALVAVAAIMILLLIQFGSLKRVLIIFISVPFGLAAGFTALYITGQPLSLFALIGAVSLLGCVLANAIVLVECISNACDEGVPLEQACKQSGCARLRPIMMSSMTTVLGLLPLALFGDTLFVPMAVLMLAGLLISMTANLVLVPMVYYLAYRKEYR